MNFRRTKVREQITLKRYELYVVGHIDAFLGNPSERA